MQGLVTMYSQAQANAGQPGSYQQPGAGPGAGPYAQPWYGPESGYGSGQGSNPNSNSTITDTNFGRPAESIGEAVVDIVGFAAGRFIGRAIKNKVQKVTEERIMPAVNAQAEQQQQEWTAIAQRYPELRACLRDQVIFLAGGTRTVPLSQVNFSQVTLAQADALVAQLRQP